MSKSACLYQVRIDFMSIIIGNDVAFKILFLFHTGKMQRKHSIKSEELEYCYWINSKEGIANKMFRKKHIEDIHRLYLKEYACYYLHASASTEWREEINNPVGWLWSEKYVESFDAIVNYILKDFIPHRQFSVRWLRTRCYRSRFCQAEVLRKSLARKCI